MQPLKEKQNILPTSDLSLLFSNWELLVGVNQEILNKLDEDPDMVGLTFLGVVCGFFFFFVTKIFGY